MRKRLLVRCIRAFEALEDRCAHLATPLLGLKNCAVCTDASVKVRGHMGIGVEIDLDVDKDVEIKIDA